ncbi:hypothetical protein N9H59_01755 [Flavobacteriaceae bacterium]|nr:hypothetical protein [Flavobacteriaceae bacterium]
MPYTNASDARIGTNQVRSNITHINSLIDAEVAKGGECIVVGPTILTEQMIVQLRNKGYVVSTRQDSMGSYKEYKIAW